MLLTLLGLWLALLISKGTRVGDLLHRALVANPAAWLSSWTRGQVLVLGLIVSAIVITVLVLGHESVLFISSAVPELMSPMLVGIEISAWVDAMVTVATVYSVTRGISALHWLRMCFSRQPTRRRATRRPRRHRPTSANDDDGPSVLAA